MEIMLKSPKLLKKSMEVISDLVIEGTIVFKPDYMELIALNSNNVVMVIFKLLKNNFEKYQIKENINISLNLENFYNVLKACDDNANLVLNMEDDRKLKIISGTEKNKKFFELSLIEFTDDNLQKIPSLEFPLKIIMESSLFTKIIGDLSFIDEGVTFNYSENEVFSLEGKNNSMSGKVDLNTGVSIKCDEKKEYNSRYSMEYLKKFTKCEKIIDSCEMSFNNEYPLKIEYKILDKLLLGFILAPRGED